MYNGKYLQTKRWTIDKIYPIIKNINLLEIGCGGGQYSCMAVKKGAKNIVTLDTQPVCVKSAIKNLEKYETNGFKVGVIGDCVSLPFKKEIFDLVICIDVIEHIQEDTAVINEILRVLRPNAFLIIASQNKISLNYLIQGAYERIIKRKQWIGWDPTHVRFYTPFSFSVLLEKFELIKHSGTYFLPYGILNVKSIKLLEKLDELIETICDKKPINSTGWGITYLCKKVSK
jgi:2-polyprenyl-6-hydroxyphenyl methylase/3-demethylubiquinone-9 3-methyltransferase